MTERSSKPLSASTLTSIKSGELYALLSVCTDDDLAPIVEVIINRFTNDIENSEDFKQHYPHHSRYSRLIGDEIRLFGGNTFRNIFRGNEGPPYDEIVLDVCKKLDIPYDAESTIKSENNLLTIYFERQWKMLSDEEKTEVMEEARKTASGQLSTINKLAKGGVLFALTRLHPIVGWGFLGFDLTEPNFRTTVPCVLHVAYLRKKVLDSQQETPDFLEEPTLSAPSASPDSTLTRQQGRSILYPGLVPAQSASEPARETERSASLTIGDSQDTPILSLTQISAPDFLQWKSIESEEGRGISRLNPLLQAVPDLATAHEVATSRYMEVAVNGNLAHAGDGAYHAWVKGADGKFVEQAKLYDPSRLSSIVNTGGLLQIASIAVAQKHLADISRKLDDIKSSVGQIQHFQKAERRSVLTGTIRYLAQVAPSVLEGELSDSIRSQIEAHESKLLEVQDHLLEDIRHESKQVVNLKDSDIQTHQKLLDDLYQQFLLCIRARVYGWQLLVIFPGEERIKEDRKREIQSTIAVLDEGDNILQDTDIFMRRKISEISSIWNANVTLNKRKLSLLEWNDTLLEKVRMCRQSVEKDLQATEAFVAERREPTKMLLKVESDRIVAISPS